MSNEDIIEEILVESYNLGIAEIVFEKVNNYIIDNNRVDAYKLAFEESKNIKQKENDGIF